MKYSPPKINLRLGRIADDNGNEINAQLRLDHKLPNDVTNAELEYYHDTFPFLAPYDLLFYLYPVIHNWAQNKNTDYLESYLYSICTYWSLLRPQLNKNDMSEIRAVFTLVRSNRAEIDWDNIESCTDIFNNVA